MMNTDPTHKHTYDVQGNIIFLRIREKTDAKIDQPVLSNTKKPSSMTKEKQVWKEYLTSFISILMLGADEYKSALKAKTMIIEKLLLFPIVIIILLLLNSCGSTVKLIYSGSQIKQPDTTAYKSIRKALWSDALVLKTKDKKRQILACDAIWGYIDNHSRYYRYYKKRFYAVIRMDSLFVYSKHHDVNHSHHTDYYFSKTADSEIFSIDKKSIRQLIQ